MANINEAFNSNNDLFYKYEDNSNIIDYFFTQRRITEHEDFIDKNMIRSKKKKIKIYSFLAINFPLEKQNLSNYKLHNIEIQIWGNLGYHYKGNLTSKEGYNPHLLIKLNGDKQIFINLIITKNDKTEKYTRFIQIPKRYQKLPFNNNDLNSENSEITNLSL